MDGETHINIYSKGVTNLGRKLSNFYRSKINTTDGEFQSIEGYWYWLGTDSSEKDTLRNLSGWEAKKVGRELRSKDWQNGERFKLKIYNAMLCKLIQDNDTLDEFLKNELPFRHYYVYGGKEVEPKEGQWIIDMWEFLRKQLK